MPASVLLRMACAADSAADKGGIASTGRVHRGGGAGCEATSLRRSGRIRRPTPSSTSTPATTPPSSISRSRDARVAGSTAYRRRAVVAVCPFLPTHRRPPRVISAAIHDSTTQCSRARRLSIACRTCATTPRPPAGGSAKGSRRSCISGSPHSRLPWRVPDGRGVGALLGGHRRLPATS